MTDGFRFQLHIQKTHNMGIYLDLSRSEGEFLYHIEDIRKHVIALLHKNPKEAIEFLRRYEIIILSIIKKVSAIFKKFLNTEKLYYNIIKNYNKMSPKEIEASLDILFQDLKELSKHLYEVREI